MNRQEANAKLRGPGPARAEGQCLCGAVAFEIGVPARWAWHDHSSATRRAHGAAYATYVGVWASRFRFLRGQDKLTRFEDAERGGVRSFCSICGSPVTFQRNKQNVNVPRALLTAARPVANRRNSAPAIMLWVPRDQLICSEIWWVLSF